MKERTRVENIRRCFERAVTEPEKIIDTLAIDLTTLLEQEILALSPETDGRYREWLSRLKSYLHLADSHDIVPAVLHAHRHALQIIAMMMRGGILTHYRFQARYIIGYLRLENDPPISEDVAARRAEALRERFAEFEEIEGTSVELNTAVRTIYRLLQEQGRSDISEKTIRESIQNQGIAQVTVTQVKQYLAEHGIVQDAVAVKVSLDTIAASLISTQPESTLPPFAEAAVSRPAQADTKSRCRCSLM